MDTFVVEGRIFYIDVLKTIAIFTIILNHVTMLAPNAEMLHIKIANIGHLGNVGVPIFLMISGILLLNRNYPDYSSFLKKKGARIILPYIFWIIVMILSFFVVNPTLNFELFKTYFTENFYDFDWYFWLMLGVYCAIPVINEFINVKKIEGASYFLKFFIVGVILYSLCILFDKHTFIDLVFFIGPISFLVLGYYFHNKNFNISNNKLFLLGVCGFLSIFLLRMFDTFPVDMYYVFLKDSSLKLFSNLNSSIFSIVEVVGLFLLIKTIFTNNVSGFLLKIKNLFLIDIVKRFFISVSKASYGMYLAHLFLIAYVFSRGLFSYSGLRTFLVVIVTTIVIFLITWILVLLVSRISLLNKFSGYS